MINSIIQAILKGRDLSKDEHEKLIEKELAAISNSVINISVIESKVEAAFCQAVNDVIVDGRYRGSADIQSSLLKVQEVCLLLGISDSSLYAHISQNRFPARREGEKGWHISDVRRLRDILNPKKKTKKNIADQAIMEAIKECEDE